jgi:hypothetical protein
MGVGGNVGEDEGGKVGEDEGGRVGDAGTRVRGGWTGASSGEGRADSSESEGGDDGIRMG